MYCSYCGTELAENASFCSHCGKAVNSADPSRNPAGKKPSTILSQIQSRIASLTIYDYFLHGMQILSLILALFFPVVQQLLSDNEIRFKVRGAFSTWSYIDRQYNYSERLEMLHGNIKFVAVILLFVALVLLGLSLMRGKRNICAIGMTAAYTIYGIVVKTLVSNKYYKSPDDGFVFTVEFWVGLILLFIALFMTLSLHKYFKKLINLAAKTWDQEKSPANKIDSKQVKEAILKKMHSKTVIIIVIGVVLLLLLLLLLGVSTPAVPK